MKIGRYEVHESLGLGGMAEVLRGSYEGPGGFRKDVAIKRILPHVADDEEFISMFIEEAKIAVQLSHPAICQVLDLGRADDSYFIAMEYIAGKSIGELAERLGESMPPGLVLKMGSDICAGLEHAHSAKRADGTSLCLVHRDITPQNVLISFEGQLKIVDFGLAKAVGRDYETRAGVVKGKLAYLSPEQVAGKDLDGRSDLFSLGICLWEWLVGHTPFERDNDIETLIAIRDEDAPELPPHVPDALRAVVVKALARDRDERFANAAEMRAALQAARADVQSISRRRLAKLMKEQFPVEVASLPPVGRPEDFDDASDATVSASRDFMSQLAARSEVALRNTDPDELAPGIIAPTLTDFDDGDATVIGATPAVSEPPEPISIDFDDDDVTTFFSE